MKINWKEPEIIEWDHRGGLTQFSPLKRTIKCFVPPATDAVRRTVRRHEALHAQYDMPVSLFDNLSAQLTDSSNITHQAIGDAFVHLDYWPWSQGEVESDEALVMAFENLREQKRSMAEEPETVDNRKMLLITLRSLAILRKCGNEDQRLGGWDIVRCYLSADILSKLDSVLDLVAVKDRKAAESAFRKLIDSE